MKNIENQEIAEITNQINLALMSLEQGSIAHLESYLKHCSHLVTQYKNNHKNNETKHDIKDKTPCTTI